MALKGDSSQIPLANIFQTLQLNGQEGVLTVASGKVRRKLRILPEGVRLLSAVRDNPEPLRLALEKQKIVTEAQFQNILSTMGQSSAYPGEFLIQRRILTRQQVEKDVQRQFQELLYEIFSWTLAKYEFNAGDHGNGLELFDPDDLGQSLMFRIPGVLMEVAHREDEWKRIRAEIPSDREIFTPVDRQGFLKPRAKEGDLDPRAIQEVKKLIDGERNVEAIIAESTFSAFETCQVLLQLQGRKEIRPLSLKEKKDLAEELRKKFKAKEVVELYTHLLEAEPEDLDIRTRLVQILERKKEISPLLVDQYLFLARHAYQAGEHAQALGFIEKILQIDSTNIDALDWLFDIHYLSKHLKDALETVRKLVAAVKTKKDYERGCEILLKILDLFPEETFLFHDLADFFIFANQGENAVLTLKSVAALYEERCELTKLRKTYERIAAIDPSEQQSLHRIQEAERRSSRPARSILAPTRSLAWSCAASVLILGVFWLISMELLARRAWALVEPDMRKCMDAGELHRARMILEDLAHRYPVSTVAIRAASQAGGLSQKEMVRDEERRRNDETEKVQFGSFLARIETLMMAKRYVDAITLVEETNRLALGPESRKKINSVESEIRGHFSSATELLRQARDLVGAGRHEEGHKLYLKLLMNYACTPAAQGLKLPLLVRSAPQGATVTLNGEAAGVTPMTIQYNPLAKFSIALSKNGFKSALFGEGTGDRKPIDFTKDWMISVRLERIPAWIFDAKAPVDCTPLIQGGRVYIGTRGGRIFCLELAAGSQVWGYDIPDGWDVSSGLQLHKDRLLFGTFDGSFHILDARTGTALQRLVPTTPPRPIRHPSSEPTEGGLVAINCGGAVVAGLNVVSGAIAWTFRPPSEALGTPEIQGGRILCATADGTILLIDPVQGTEAGRIAVGSRLEVPGKTAEGSYIVGDSSGRIRSLLLATGAVQWTYESPLENPTPAAIGGGLVFFGSKAGLLAALDIRSGDLRWKGKVGDAILAPPSWANGNFYLGTKGGQALCLDGPSGTPEWSYMAAGSIAASPAGAEKFVLFGSDDHRLYAFSE